MRSAEQKTRGFSLIELLIAMALGLIVLGATTQLFKSGMDASTLVTQSSEMHQNARASLNLIAKDVSMAGSGLPSGGLALPYGAGSTLSKFAVGGGQAWLANNTYPTNYMYGIISGVGNGIEVGNPPIAATAATGKVSDAITVVYADYAFPLNQYTVTFPVATNPNGDLVTFTPPAAPPAGFPAIQSPTGIQVGDLILFKNNAGSVVGEVTGITPVGAKTNLAFANADPLNMNQSGAANANIKYILGGGATVATRIWAVSYFIEVPAAATGQTPRLMRQVNGLKAMPVADNVIDLAITYDMCDGTNGPNCSGIQNAQAAPFSPNQIHKVNIQVMGQTLNSFGNKSRSTVLATSVSTRSLDFKDRYQ
jgi:type IV pilus assembly protein PilW